MQKILEGMTGVVVGRSRSGSRASTNRDRM